MTRPLLLAVVTFLGGCGVDLPDDEVWTSEHFRYHVWDHEEAACRAITSTLERHLALTIQFFALPVPSKPIDYYKFLSREELEGSGACPEFAQACADTLDLEVFSGRAMDRHELTHAYFAPLGLSQLVLEEGAASALDCRLVAAPPKKVDWREAFAAQGADFEPSLASAAARLVSYLVLTYGAPKFVELYASLPRSLTPDQADDVFRALYGFPLPEAWQTALAQQNTELSCLRLWECAAPAVALGSNDFQLHQQCDQADEFRSFQVDTRGPYLHEDPYFSSGLRVASCDPFRPAVHEQHIDPTWGDIGAQLQVFEAGHYFVASAVYPGAAWVEAVPDAFASTCSSDSRRFADALNLYAPGLTVYPEPGRLAGAPLMMKFPVNEYSGMLVAESSPGVTVRACGGCIGEAPNDCTVLSPKGPAAGVITSAAAIIEVEDSGAGPQPWFRLQVE